MTRENGNAKTKNRLNYDLFGYTLISLNVINFNSNYKSHAQSGSWLRVMWARIKQTACLFFPVLIEGLVEFPKLGSFLGYLISLRKRFQLKSRVHALIGLNFFWVHKKNLVKVGIPIL